MLPTCITIAYALTKIVEKNEKYFKKIIAVLGMSVIIIFFGNSIFNQHTTVEVNNYYKLPDEVVEIAFIISGDTENERKKAIVPYGMSSQIRQVCADIELYYSRLVYNSKDENGNSFPHDTDDASNYPPVKNLNDGNVEYIAKLCKESNTNYVVFPKTTNLTYKMENYNFELYNQTKNYDIYRLKK